MKFYREKIQDVVVCVPDLIEDDRGYFAEIYRNDLIEDFIGRKLVFCQENESKSGLGVLRGLHYQLPPMAQTKLVRVTEGQIQDVVIDLRQESPHFGKHISIELSDKNRKQLLVPRGFAHGFLVLSEFAVVVYKVDNMFSPTHDRSLNYADPALDIDWQFPTKSLKLSSKDKNSPMLEEVLKSQKIDLF